MTLKRVPANLCAAAGECIIHNKPRTRVGLLLFDVIPNVLETKLVNRPRIQNGHVHDLQDMQSIGIVVSARRQCEPADALLIQILGVEVVTDAQSVVLVYSQIKPWPNVPKGLGRNDGQIYFLRIERSIQRGRRYDGRVLDIAARPIKEKRTSLRNRSTEITFE